jgi:hypothetical protein
MLYDIISPCFEARKKEAMPSARPAIASLLSLVEKLTVRGL